MIPETLRQVLRQKLFPGGPDGLRFQPVGGGSINSTFQVAAGKGAFFCKINSASKFPQLFEAEKHGLQLLAAQKIIRVPAVVDCFECGDLQVLVLEWVEQGQRSERFWTRFGEQMAGLHSASCTSFGLERDNYMGSIRQLNTRAEDWPIFFRDQRLAPLVHLCMEKKLLGDRHRLLFENVYLRLSEIFDPAGPPSMVHGDLWSGNFMCDHNGDPMLIDPAVYYGHRAVDLAMTTLFGGFHSTFYDAYRQCCPLPPHHTLQWEVCNLYPLLVHLVLFGKSYLPGIEQTLARFQ